MASVVAIRRYPVKAMEGESLTSVAVDARGLVGDRGLAVVDSDGMFAAGKRGSRWVPHEEVLAYRARTVDDAVVVSRGDLAWRAGDAGLDADLSAAAGEPLRVVAEAPDAARPFFDSSPISVVGTATLDWCRTELGVDADPRRLRVNVVIDTDEPFVEETWIGAEVEVGGVRLRATKRNGRCRVIDLAQDGLGATARFLKPLGDRRDACVAVYCEVVEPGEVRVGDPVVPPRV
ncbi:MOSC domain-containing protein [Demequina sp. SYSU T00192]|uniref:MOSC domain-containing protein n=1 Tax=Demequina litoralis TaxID=3051660 RepID=A0ABT8G7N3_9MICO|nr:MOSC domain-containing protein [Demequina sp. SYSU T00192]MDN4475145.1 MOSC domain-containing protein [Demequina sp. SYSU T00192]